MSLVDIHARLANTAIFFCIAMALWGGWRFLRKQGLGSNYWGALAIAEGLILVQGILGASLWFGGARPERGGMHVLYGVVSALAIPIIYTYTKGRERRTEMLMYMLVFFALVGLLLRGVVTGI